MGMTGTAFFTALDKIEELEVELTYRRRVYPRLVSEGRMARDKARRRIEIMEAVKLDYERAVAANPQAHGLLV